MKRTHKLWLHLATFFSLTLIGAATFGLQIAFAGKVAPNTFALNASVGFQDVEILRASLSQALAVFETQLVSVRFRNQPYSFSLNQLGIQIDREATLDSIPVITMDQSPWSISGGLLHKKNVQTIFSFDEAVFNQALQTAIVDLNMPVQDARLVFISASQDFDVIGEQPGWEADVESFRYDLFEHIAVLESSPFELAVHEIVPQIIAADLNVAKETLRPKLLQTTDLFTSFDRWSVVWKDHMDLLDFVARKGLSGSTEIVLHLHPDPWKTYLQSTFASELEEEPQDVTIVQSETGLISFEGTAVNGIKIQQDALQELVEWGLNAMIPKVEIPLTETLGQVNAPQALRDLGIQELVSVGYTGFKGSPYNRKHNIRTAMKRFDGALIAPGETFSFGKQLGVVDASTGYAKELVIKEDRTIPEYGGGICQVSSTTYRGALNAGFPILKRSPHSYAVAYYAYPNGFGLDATVYPPSVDLVFQNDTAHSILIQAFLTEQNEAFVKFYGTRDGRQTYLEGPVRLGSVAAPPVKYIVTEEKAPGEMEKVDNAHNGLTVSWDRTVVYPDGRTQEETIVSRYEARAETWLVGKGTEGFEEDEAVETQD